MNATKLGTTLACWAGLALAAAAGLTPAGRGDPAPAADAVDVTTLRHRVLCGYQGWFRCPGDGTGDGWLHWSRDRRLVPQTLTFEMWPDVSDYGEGQKYPAPGFSHPDGRPAQLFSSADPATVDCHFQWMRDYGIDGVFVQRFLVELRRPSFDKVLANVRMSAARHGRAYAVCYDLSGAPADRLYDMLVNDWKRLVDEEKVTGDDRYLRHGGRPVLFVWGFFADRFDAALAHKIIDFFHADGPYRVTLVGGCQWQWRTVKDAEWARAFRRLDVISPWNVGNYAVEGGHKVAATDYWKADLAEAKKHGAVYLPVIYPGFGWTNIKGKAAEKNTIPRRKGEFFWRQFVTAADLGVDSAYVAMFDEVDEGTAVFKVTNAPPTQARFATYEGMPPDWYLRLTGEGARVIRGEREGKLPLPSGP